MAPAGILRRFDQGGRLDPRQFDFMAPLFAGFPLLSLDFKRRNGVRRRGREGQQRKGD